MKYTGPVRFILKGDFNLAQRYTSRSRLLLQQAMDRMGPDKAYWIKTLPDGTQITVSSLGGVKQVWIDTLPKGPEDAPRGYMIVTKDSEESDKYLSLFSGYNQLLDREYKTGPYEWTGHNYVISASPDIYRRNRETEVVHNAIYAFSNRGNTYSFDAAYNLYNDDTIVNSDLISETDIKKVVASTDGSNIALLKEIDDQIANEVSIKVYSVGDKIDDSVILENISNISNTFPGSLVGSSADIPFSESIDIPDGYLWTVRKISSGSCSYGGVAKTYIYTSSESTNNNTNMSSTECDIIADIEYINTDEYAVAGIVDINFWTTQSITETNKITRRYSGGIPSETETIPQEAYDLCAAHPDAPIGTYLSEVYEEENTQVLSEYSVNTNNYLSKVKIGSLNLTAYEEQYISTILNKSTDGGINYYSAAADVRSTVTARAGIIWSIKNSTIIYLETQYDYDQLNDVWETSDYVNRIVVEFPDKRIVLWEDVLMQSERFVFTTLYDLGGIIPAEERLFRQTIGFFEDYNSFSRLNSSAITLSYVDRHTDANSDVLVVDLAITGMDDFRYAHDCTGKGAEKRMQDILDNDNFQVFTAI